MICMHLSHSQVYQYILKAFLSIFNMPFQIHLAINMHIEHLVTYTFSISNPSPNMLVSSANSMNNKTLTLFYIP